MKNITLTEVRDWIEKYNVLLKHTHFFKQTRILRVLERDPFTQDPNFGYILGWARLYLSSEFKTILAASDFPGCKNNTFKTPWNVHQLLLRGITSTNTELISSKHMYKFENLIVRRLSSLYNVSHYVSYVDNDIITHRIQYPLVDIYDQNLNAESTAILSTHEINWDPNLGHYPLLYMIDDLSANMQLLDYFKCLVNLKVGSSSLQKLVDNLSEDTATRLETNKVDLAIKVSVMLENQWPPAGHLENTLALYECSDIQTLQTLISTVGVKYAEDENRYMPVL